MRRLSRGHFAGGLFRGAGSEITQDDLGSIDETAPQGQDFRRHGDRRAPNDCAVTKNGMVTFFAAAALQRRAE